MHNTARNTLQSAGSAPETPTERVAGVAWDRVQADLDGNGFAVIEGLLNPLQCRTVAALYPEDSHFRSHVVMARHGFGRGEYKYFAYELPTSSLTSGRRLILIFHVSPIAGMRTWG